MTRLNIPFTLFVVAFALLLSACGSKSESISEDSFSGFGSQTPSSLRSENEPAPSNRFLAYEHHLEVTLKNAEIEKTFNALVDLCVKDTRFNCSVLHSSNQGGEYANASLRLRLKSEGVEELSKRAAEGGEVVSQSTQAEDLGGAVADAEKRIEMLTSYRDRLLELEKKPDNDIDSLIKISSELATVQTQIEYTSGEKQRLYQRIDLDILNISLRSDYEFAFYEPVTEALGTFFENLSEGIAIFINVVAYLLPWIIAITILLIVIRKYWRKKSTR